MKNVYHSDRPSAKIIVVFFFIFFILVQPLQAHIIPGQLENMSTSDAVSLYVKMGFLHIIPFGFDHMLFILSLFLLSTRIKPLLWQVTAFTVAHSVTLILSMYQVIPPAPKIIEPLITLSILYVALENIFSPTLKTSRIGVIFLFGLIHGMGFAGALVQIGLPRQAFLLSLVMFNVGVELGQLSIILLARLFISKWFGNKPFYRKCIVIPCSAIIAGIACIWTIQRIVS